MADPATVRGLLALPAFVPPPRPDIGCQLQRDGERLLRLLAVDPDGVAAPARGLAAQLGERNWPGDRELAALLLSWPEPGRPLIRADLEAVADLLEGPLADTFGGWLDTRTGETWTAEPLSPRDRPADVDDDADRYLFVPAFGAEDARQDVCDFTARVPDPGVRRSLLWAAQSDRPFSAFRAAIDRTPRLRREWDDFSRERRVGRARQWLAAEGYHVLTP